MAETLAPRSALQPFECQGREARASIRDGDGASVGLRRWSFASGWRARRPGPLNQLKWLNAMMTGVDYVLEAELTGPLAGQWMAAFGKAISESIARWAVDQIDLERGVPRNSWTALDDPTTRAVAIASDPLLGPRLSEILVPDARGGEHRALEGAIGRAGMSGRQSGPKLRARIAAMTPRWLALPNIVPLVTDFPLPACWQFIANEIGRRVYGQYAVWRMGGVANEWRLMNHLLLAEYFRQCRHTAIKHVAHDLIDAAGGGMGVRGSLVNTSRWISPSVVAEATIPISGFGGRILLKHQNRSTLFVALHRESTATAIGNGVMHRIAGPHTQDAPELVRSGQTDRDAWLRGRDFAFLRYERSILTYMGLAGIEQLVRALATKSGVPNYRPNGAPDGIPGIVQSSQMGLSAPLAERICMIFDSGKGNIRNRMMHGVFLLTGKRLQDNLIAGGLAERPSPLERDPHTTENIANLVLECLQCLDTEVSNSGLSDADFNWGASTRLSIPQFEAGKVLAQDLVPSDDGSNFEVVDAHRKWLSAYFRAMFPGLGNLFRLGYIGFIQRYSQDTIPLVHSLAIIFEATFRLTCHLMKMEVVDKPEMPPGAKHPICLQYLMLDKNGLCKPSYYDRLTEHGESLARAGMRETLESAVCARNALSHGAIIAFDKITLNVISRTLMAAIQILASAGMHHMIREKAWYRWQDLRQFQHGYHEEDWLAAERTLKNWVRLKGQLPRV